MYWLAAKGSYFASCWSSWILKLQSNFDAIATAILTEVTFDSRHFEQVLTIVSEDRSMGGQEEDRKIRLDHLSYWSYLRMIWKVSLISGCSQHLKHPHCFDEKSDLKLG